MKSPPPHADGEDLPSARREARRTGACFWIATWFGTGLAPIAPGTWGTLASLPAHFALALLPAPLHLAGIMLVIALGVHCAARVAAAMQVDDPQIVVIDETAGVLLALFVAAPQNLFEIAAAAFLFRVLDIIKPWPIGAAERLRPAGLGIMADDLIAGLIAGLVVLLVF